MDIRANNQIVYVVFLVENSTKIIRDSTFLV